jgi:GT2 family glycosyltransferase
VDVSVVIASHGRPKSLVRCLESLCAQTLPRDRFEVVVCDDESPEPIEPLVAGFAERLWQRLVRQPHAGPAAARNQGARHAAGRLLAFTDDDCVPAPEWLELLLARTARHPGHLVGGSIVNLLPGDPYATATQLIMSCVYDYYARHPAGQRFYSTTNLAAPASRFWLLHGFSERFPRAAGEDYDFCARWHEAGFPDVYAPEVEVGHGHAHNFRSFLRQHFNYGRALFRVREGMARRRGHAGIELESPSFYREILFYPLRQRLGARALGYTALVLLSQAATAAGAFWEWVIAPDPSFKQPEAPVVESDAAAATPAHISGEQRRGGRRPSPSPGATRAPRVKDAPSTGPGARP